jgi:type VI secretion system secreted protein VgrG
MVVELSKRASGRGPPMTSPLVLTTPLGTDALLVKGFSGTEGISQLFSVDVDLVAANSTAVPFEQLLGQPMSLAMTLPGAAGGTRFFNGICNRVSQGGRDSTFTSYRVEVVPWLWLLTRSRNSRIFQGKPVPDIVESVFAGYPNAPVTFELKTTYQPREYCVQYRESDFAFVSRLMEEEGIFYFFRHTADGHEMVIGDSNAAFPSVPGPATESFATNPPPRAGTTTVFEWEKSQELRSGLVTLRDHQFEVPNNHFEAKAPTPDAVRVGIVTHHLSVGGNSKLELYDFPGGYAKRFDAIGSGGAEDDTQLAKIQPAAARTAAIRMQQEAMQALEIDGASDCRQFTAGHTFTLKGHFNANGKYYIMGCTHRAGVSGDPAATTQSSVSYHNTFEVLPSTFTYRSPRSTPLPVISTQTAVVVGPAGEQIFTDKYGRVKVQFHWDREGKNDADSSCWVRVGALHAGQEHGYSVAPRIGQEVVVDFLEGDPDQPIIVGSAYDPSHLPPTPDQNGGG